MAALSPTGLHCALQSVRQSVCLIKAYTLRTKELKTARRHMMPPQQRVRNGLARPADKSMLAQDNGTVIETL